MTSITTATAATTDVEDVAPVVPAARPAGVGATAVAVAGRTLRKYVRSPQLLVMSIANGVIFMVLFRYVFGGAIDLGPVAYVDFLVPGMVLTWVLVAGVGSATGIAEDVDQGFFDRLRSLPVPRLGLLGGRVLAETLIMTWSCVAIAAMGFLVGFRLQGDVGEAALALGLCVVCGFAFTWVFVCIGLVAGNAQAAQGMAMLVWPIVFLSSAYVRVDTLPSWIQAVAEHQPVTVMSNAVRSLALGDPALAGLDHSTAYWVVLSLVWAAGITLVFAPLAVARHNRAP